MHEADVVVIGAGAAGLAAAQRLKSAQIAALVVEARSRIGGRAFTWREPSGLPLDLGCGWLHSANSNEWDTIARELGFAVDPRSPPWSRPALEAGFPVAEQKDFRAAQARLYARLAAAAGGEPDRPASELLEPGSRWNPLLNAVSSYVNGVELDRLSVRDFGRYRDTGVNRRVAEGYGALMQAYGAGLDVRIDAPATLIDHSGARLRVETPRGAITARAAIVTVPASVIACEAIRFVPNLQDKLDSAAALPLGLADKLFLRVDQPDDLPDETRLFGAVDRTATGSYHLKPFGRPLIEVYFGGGCARELEAEGDAAFMQFATDELAALLGGDIRNRVHPIAVSSWGRDPYALGSYTYAKVGHADARAVLAPPVDSRLFFAGEACSPHDFSTAHGAYRTGVEAAEQVIQALDSRDRVQRVRSPSPP